MLGLLKNKKAQSTIEYALLIAVVVGAFTAMQLYNRRALNLRVKRGMDRIPFAVAAQEHGTDEDGNPNPTSETPLIAKDGSSIFGYKNQTQYEPYYYAAGDYYMNTTSTEGTEESNVANRGGNRTLENRTSERKGWQAVTGTEEVLH